MAKRRRTKSRLRSFGRRVAQLLLFATVLVAVTGVYVAWLDREVRTAFEGKRWALPARVFAQPLELYPGRDLSIAALQRELSALGYRAVADPQRAGEYSQNGPVLRVHTRRFQFWDGTEPGRNVEIRFTGNQIQSIADIATQSTVPVFRLEPQLIGKIYPEHREDRILVRHDEVPELLIQALLAVEDRNFYEHRGIDPAAIARAAWVNLRARSIRQGGSTLTQQLVKNLYLTREQSWWRKFNEAIMAMLLEARYEKSAILEAYLNEVYLGQHGGNAIHGFGLAAEFYFHRPLEELNIEQLAMLVGLARGASYYNPRRHPERARLRRNIVLQSMATQGVIDADQAGRLQQLDLGISRIPGWTSDRYPAFIDLVRRQLRRDYASDDLRNEGLQIFTTLNPQHQYTAQQALDRRLQELEAAGRGEFLQGAVIIASVDTGEVSAVVGTRSDAAVGFNRALDARRPIGSLVKPAIYMLALEQPERYNVLTLLDDAPVRLPQPAGGEWVPENYDRKVHGEVAMHVAMAQSYNLATVNLGLALGVERVAGRLQALTPAVNIRPYPSLFLGAVDLSPLEVTQIYQILAGRGFRTPLKSILAVLDHEGKPLSRYPLEVEQVAKPEPAYLTTYLLTQAVQRGTAQSAASRLSAYMPLAGKTGTTNELRDSWFAGYGSDILSVVWVGRDDNQPAGLTGAAGALQVWSDMMQALKPQPVDMTPPEGVIWQRILAGQRTDPDCSHAPAFPFTAPHLPEGYLPCRQPPSPPTERRTWLDNLSPGR